MPTPIPRPLRRVLAGAFALSLLAVNAGAQQGGPGVLSGRVFDSAGAPIAGVRVVVVELGRRAQTAAAGTYRLSSLPQGSYTVSFSRIGLAPETRRIELAGAPATLDVRLRAAGIALPAVQVSASAHATSAQDSPQPISVLEGPELRVAQGGALGDVLEQLPGVRTLSMTTGIGKPVIRGMTHYRVVTLDNGQRTETQAWGHDHSPNVETAAAERIEVIKGPASVLHGSDALGGVINVIAPALPDAIDAPGFLRGRVVAAYNHNVRGGDGTLSLEGARGGVGARLALTSRASGDMRTPDGPLGNTNNRAIAPDLAVGVRGTRGTIAARYTSRDERIEIFDDPSTSPGYTGYQRIATHRAAVDATTPLRGATLQLSAGYEQNYRREFAGVSAELPALGLMVRNWTGFAHLNHPAIGPFSGTLGVSGMTSQFQNLGTETLIPDSDTRSAAVFLFEQADFGRFTAMFGARADQRTLSTTGNAAIGIAAQERDFSAVTGSAGALYRVTDVLSLVANVARGFRAPAAPDLFANGFHEGTRAFERGNPSLGVETSLNADVGVRVSAHDLTGEATVFVNRVSDYIYLRPFGTSGDTFDSLQVVQGDARLAGVEARVSYRPVEPLTLQLSGDYVRGDNTSAGVPLTFVPPMRLLYGARLERRAPHGAIVAPYLSLLGETNWRQTRLDPRDTAPPGYTTVALGGGLGVAVPRGVVSVDLSLRNLLDTSYRSFMSRYKDFALAPGRMLVLRVSSPL